MPIPPKHDDSLKIISDEKELEKFYHSVMPELAENEGWFVSLSCRSKKMTDEERAKYKLTHKEMFARDIVFKPGYEAFASALYSYHRHKRSFPGMFLEPKALVCYMNINPVSTGKALNEFKKRLADWEYKKLYENASEGFMPFKNLYNSYHISRGTKHYIDIDIDWNSEHEHLDAETLEIENYMRNIPSKAGFENGKDYFMIITGSGGIHVLVKVSALRKQIVNAKLQIAEPLARIFKDKAKEVKINSDAMVPIPGTQQYGKTVHLTTTFLTVPPCLTK